MQQQQQLADEGPSSEEDHPRKRKSTEKHTVSASSTPQPLYQKKYERLLGKDTAKDAARKTQTNDQYGFVPSSNKKDSRSIEQTLADIRAKKKQKIDE